MPGVDFEKKDHNVKFDSLQYELSNLPLTNGTVVVPQADVRKLIDSGANYSTLLRVFENGHNSQSFFSRSIQHPYGQEGPIAVVGPSIHQALEDAILYPQDQVDIVNPNVVSTDPDYEFRAENVLVNGDAESGEGSWVGDDFETGITLNSEWSVVTGDAYNAVSSYGVSSAYAAGGTYSMSLNPSNAGSDKRAAIRRSGIPCSPGTIVKITAVLRAPGDPGVRIGFGVTFEEGGGGVQSSLNPYIEDDLVVVEVGNASKGTGSAPSGSWQTTELWFLTGPNQTSFDFHFIAWDDGADYEHVYIDNIVLTGVGVGIAPWFTWNGVSLIRQNSTVYEGAWAFQFQVYDHSVTEHTQGVLQLVNTGADLGRTGTFTVWVRSGSARDVTALIKRGSATWIASQGKTLVPSTWTYFEVSGVVDEEQFYVEIRDAETALPGGTDGPPIQFDNAEFWFGLGEQTAGAILQNFFDQVKARGTLTWLKTDGFDGDTDSNGVTYADTEELVFWHGMNLLQVMDVFKGLGYEWDIVWNDAEETYEFEFYVPNTMGGDLTLDDFKVHPPSIPQGADITEMDPGYNTFLIEGETGVFQEGEHGTLAAAYGRREKYISFENAASAFALVGVVLNQIIKADRRKFALTASVPETFTSGLTARPGSLLKVHFSGMVDELQLRVARIMVTVDQEGLVSKVINFGENNYKEDIGGTTSTATSRALNDLLRKFHRRVQPGGGGGGGEGGGAPTVVICTTDSSEFSKGRADFQCGTSDAALIVNAMFASLGAFKGRLLLTEGTFGATEKVVVPDGFTIEGMGRGTRWVASVNDDWAIDVRHGGLLEKLNITNPDGSGARVVQPGC